MAVPLPALLLLLTLSADGQAARECRVQGTVVDPRGNALPGVVVSVPGRAPVVTDAKGRYCIVDLPTDARSIVIALDGFVSRTLPVDPASREAQTHDTTLAPSFAERLVVTGTRTTRLADTVPVRTEVIDRRAIAASAARSLADAVEYTTGIRVENNCQNCNFSQIRLLGLDGPYTQILVDGQPIISSLAQVYGIEQIPARMIDRIEVVKGGGSSLYGAGAVGGVVNLISPEPSRTGGGLEYRVDRGGGLGGSIDWASNDLSTLLTAFVQRDTVDARDVNGDGFSDVSRRRLTAGGARLVRASLGGSGKFTVDVSHIREARRGGDDIDRPPHETLIAEDIASRRSSLSASWYQHISGGWDYRLTTAGALTDRDSYYGTGRDPNAYGDTTSRLVLIDGQINRYLGSHIVSWGAQGSRERMIDRQPAYARLLDHTVTNGGIFAQDDWTIRPGVQLVSGLRADWHSALARPIVSPRAALMLSPSDTLDIRVSGARGFRAPQVFDEDLHLSSVAGEVRLIRLDPDLREERATSTMAGVEWKPQAGPGQALFEANLFHTRLTDLFHVVDDDDPLTEAFEARKINFGGARVYGVELNAGWGIGDDLVIQGGVVVQRARFDMAEPDFGSRDFFRTPRRYGNLSLRWQSHGGWQLFAGARTTGRMRAPHYAGAIATNRLEVTPVMTTYDLSVGRRVALGGRTLVITVSGRNLTNVYQRDLDVGPFRDANYVYGPRFPRTISLTAGWDF